MQNCKAFLVSEAERRNVRRRKRFQHVVSFLVGLRTYQHPCSILQYWFSPRVEVGNFFTLFCEHYENDGVGGIIIIIIIIIITTTTTTTTTPAY